MVKSSLTDYEVLANSSNHSSGRNGNEISKITIHHMAGKLTSKQCGAIFQTAGRNASSNYGIGYDGDIAIYVSEENRAWTSSSATNDRKAITIEVSNSVVSSDWPVSEASMDALVNLCTDVCKRYNFTLNYTGDENGNLTKHSYFASTSCPGPTLGGRFQEIADRVNANLGGTSTSGSTSTTTATLKSTAEIVAEVIAGKWGSGTDRKTKLEKAGYNYTTIQNAVNAKLNGTTTSTSALKSTNTIAAEVIAGKWGNGADRKTNLEKAGYNYSTIQAAVNKLL